MADEKLPSGPSGADPATPGAKMVDRFAVPEPSPNMGSGFLTEIWRGDLALPTMRGAELYSYYIRKGLRSLLALPGSNAITVLTIAISFFLFSGFLSILQNVDRVISDAGTSLNLTVYFKEGVADNAMSAFVEDLKKDPSFRSVDFVSKTRALELFREHLGAHSGFVEGLEGENPLPASVDIVLHPDELGVSSVDKTLERLRRADEVGEVVYGSEWVGKMQGVIRVFRLFALAALLIVLTVITFLIANTIKLVIYSRRDELEIMQLVGASDFFIRMPFIIGGVIQGIMGSIVSLVILRFGFFLINFELQRSTVFGVALPQLDFIGFFPALGVILAGLLIGALGSFFALGRFMDV